MPRSRLTVVVLALLLVPMSAWAVPSDDESMHERRIDRLVASPTPIGPLRVHDDAHVYRVHAPEHAVVRIDADADRGSLFTMTWWQNGTTEPSRVTFASNAQTIQVPAGVWLVKVDPVAGVNVHIVVTFRGHWNDDGGGPAPIAVEDVHIGDGCGEAGVCIP